MIGLAVPYVAPAEGALVHLPDFVVSPRPDHATLCGEAICVAMHFRLSCRPAIWLEVKDRGLCNWEKYGIIRRVHEGGTVGNRRF